MPCRANRCHRAASSLLQCPPAQTQPQSQYIWINDDLLAQAFARFSKTVPLTSRRHGSNVPGPLEARKRLARRRMVGLAHHAGAPMPDFGSLFGTGPGPVDVASLWKAPTSDPVAASHLPHQFTYPTENATTDVFWSRSNPPSTVSYARPAKRTLPLLPKKPKDYTRSLRRCTNFDSILQLHAQLYPAGDVPLSFSRAAFQQLLANAATPWKQHASLHPQHLEDIVRFLQRGLNHYLSGNAEAYYLWFRDKALPPQAFSQFVQLLCDKIALANMPQPEVQSIIRALSLTHLASVPPEQRDSLLADAYSAISKALLERLPSHARPTQRYQDCAALLEGLGNLAPTLDTADLVLSAYHPLPADQQGCLAPLVAQCLHQWLHRLVNAATLTTDSIEAKPSPMLHLLNRLEPRHAESVVINATARFLTDEAISTLDRKAGIPYWLYLLRHCDHLRNAAWNSSPWSHIYPALFDSLSPLDVDAHLAAIGAVDAARVVLRYWIRPRLLDGIEPPRLTTISSPSPRLDGVAVSYTVSHSTKAVPSDESISLRHLARTLKSAKPASAVTQPKSAPTKPLPSPFNDAFIDGMERDLETRIAAYDMKCPPEIGPFLDLVAIIHRSGLNHEHVLNQTIKLLLRYHPPRRIFTFAMKLVKGSVYIPAAIAVPLISFLVDSGNPGYALRIYQACNDVWPSHCPELVFALIENGPVHSHHLFEILNRSEFENSMPESMRSESNNSLSEQRVQFIHHMAHALAVSPHLTPRQSFRRVCDCLLYLHSRKAPLSSLISRALVTSGVIRDLQDGHWVSTVKFQWIIEFVKKYEGEHVAAQLDRIAFQWRSDNVDKYGLAERLDHLYKQEDIAAARYRQSLGHASHRWKRRTVQWKPWLAQNMKPRSAKGEKETIKPKNLKVKHEPETVSFYSPPMAAAASG